MPTTRSIALIGLAVSALASGTAPTPASAAAKPLGPVLKIESKTCNTGIPADSRSVVLTASAVLRDAGEEVQMRFSVQQRATAKAVWRSVFAKVGDLGTWATSEPGADGLRYTKTINGLAEGMQYRVVVDARGVNAAGKVVTKTSKRTYTCIQPQLSPHLQLQKVTQPAAPALASQLRTTIRNSGRDTSAAPVITVRDFATQAVLGQLTVDPLAGRTTKVFSVELSDCPGTVSVSVQETGAALSDVTPDQAVTFDCRTGESPAATRSQRRR
ncbi:MAG: hypothetical protein J7513_10255 [Solirubrobacteraceae bacterium]|nr:hypothetical protein [Solirubrobacteraceae bacterium]